MAKGKKSKGKQQAPRSRGVQLTPRQEAQQAFESGRFSEALKFLTPLIPRDPAARPLAAEVYFRRALSSSKADPLEDLRQAIQLVPQDLRFAFHLGRLLHLEGQYDAAEKRYRAVLAQEPTYEPAARLLALLTLERQPDADVSQLPGMTPALERWLAPALALLHKQPLPNDPSPLGSVWQGLAQLAADDTAAASKALSDDRSLANAALHRIRRYYRGLAAAMMNDEATAHKNWGQIFEGSKRPPYFEERFGLLHYQELTLLDKAGEYEAAAKLALALRTLKGDPALDEVRLRVLDRWAHTLASRNQWREAGEHWLAARDILSTSQAKNLGSPRPLLHNLALAYEHQERWGDAAETWRALLRIRPRKRSGEQEDALEAQRWAWVRKRIIKGYKEVGNLEEAIAILRQMIKLEPDDVDLRVDLAGALYENEQDRASQNELRRALEIDPYHPEAAVRYAMSITEYWQFAEGKQIVKAMAEHQAAKPEVQRQAAAVFAHYAGEYVRYHRMDLAENAFEEAVRYDPNNGIYAISRLRMQIYHAESVDVGAGLDHALKVDSERHSVWHAAIETWHLLNDPAECHALWMRYLHERRPGAQEIRTLSASFLAKVVPPPNSANLQMGIAPPHVETPWTALLLEMYEALIAASAYDPKAYNDILPILILPLAPQALRLATEGVERHPNNAELLINKGVALVLCNRSEDAKIALQQASHMARKQGLRDLQQVARDYQNMADSPKKLVQHLHMLAFEGIEDLLGDLDLDDLDLDELRNMLDDMF
ncbi:MAG: tetratricopeptide repeat protein [Candidatus Viridilinea halotolerans]|uniref:Tetratricopeptide repeat protein n=1 Tax=Candidatus Viridilinea halotolerans TaxID=2491704 RepID=A0A426TYR0_9CHLR|nr:MAG: tetratricopeptide repeat protein [Candidatus Viridilinea halotolerans]